MQLVVSPMTRAGPPSATHPPAATVSVRGDPTARDLPLICPFIALHTIRGSREGHGGWAEGKQREKTKALLRGGQKAGCLLPLLPGPPGPPVPGLGHPQAAGDLPHPVETSLRPHVVPPLAG